MSPNVHYLLNLFDRPSMPVFMARYNSRDKKDIAFDCENLHCQPPEHNEVIEKMREDLTVKRIVVKHVKLSTTEISKCLGLKDNFSLFIPQHRKIAGQIIEILMKTANCDDFLHHAVHYQGRINPYLYIYCLSVAMLHLPDTQHIALPINSQVFPDNYIDRRAFKMAIDDSNPSEPKNDPVEIPQNYTATDLDEEHRVAYFREDLGINLHHWHWHLVYPAEGPKNIIDKDRRGELFYYMHSQIIARYNYERFCNALPRVKRWNNWREPIAEGYFPKLDSLVTNSAWPSRQPYSMLQDVNRPVNGLQFDIADLERWRDRIFEAVHTGFMTNAGGKLVKLTEKDGINELGNIIESSDLSFNKKLYGDLHNYMHLALSYIHDPDHRYLESFSTIGNNSTAMRDPMFYRLHQFIDEIFQLHKRTLPPYNPQQLDYPGVKITGVNVVTDDQERNILCTYWKKSHVDMSRGLDFTSSKMLLAHLTHLQHRPYTFTIEVKNDTETTKQGTCRIFMAPKIDERGMPMVFKDQKNFMIELDKFTVSLNPGENTIARKSDESSVTIPFDRTFRNLSDEPDDRSEFPELNYCGCGWPQHMLIPKGTKDGFSSELFVMISNYDGDKIVQDIEGQCVHGVSYCGIRNKNYPDARPMGFPFDRSLKNDLALAQFLSPNMKTVDVTIRHSNEEPEPCYH